MERKGKAAATAVNSAVFAVGVNSVSAEMLAKRHEGEAIVPKACNPSTDAIAMLAEMRALREESKEQAARILEMQERIAKILSRWDGDGLPSARSL